MSNHAWESLPLEYCGKWLSGGTPNTENTSYWDGDIPWITASSLRSFHIENSERKITPLGLKNGSRLVPKDSILFVVRGMSLKSEFRIGITRRAVAFGQDCKAIMPSNTTDPLFLAYALSAKRSEILGMVDEAGHGTGRLQTDRLQKLKIPLPPLPEQRAIASILGSLDDKIELNRRMNETLEALAQTLFKSWFIDPTRNGLPNGWREVPFTDMVQILGGGTPKTSVAGYWGGHISWFSVVDAPAGSDVFVIETEKKITYAGLENSSTQVLPIGTTIISARGTVGRVALVGVPMAMNQSCYGIRGLAGQKGYHTYFATKALVSRLQQRAHGSVFDTITRDTLASVSVAIPPLDLIELFEEKISPIMEYIRRNLFESRTLATLRDTLLPKLLSGELRIPVSSSLLA